MTVQELIDELMKISNPNKHVCDYNGWELEFELEEDADFVFVDLQRYKRLC